MCQHSTPGWRQGQQQHVVDTHVGRDRHWQLAEDADLATTCILPILLLHTNTAHPAQPPLLLLCTPLLLQDGRRDGIGIKTYADGSMYDGFWRAGKKHGLGVFRPAPEETGSRRHSNHAGWQPQQQRASGAGSPEAAPTDLAAQSVFAVQELAAASVSSEANDAAGTAGAAPTIAATTAAPAAAAAVATAAREGMHLQELRGVNSAVGSSAPLAGVVVQPPPPPLQQQPPHAQRQGLAKQRSVGKQHLVSPFLAAAAALNSETSIIGEPPRVLNGSWQHKPPADLAEAPAAPAMDSSGNAAGASDRSAAAAAAAAADGAGPSSSAPGSKAAAGEGTDSTSVVPAGGVLGPGAPRKLFVREYDMGQLVREYPLTAEEIKMIFGFLWPKANKVRVVCVGGGGVSGWGGNWYGA